MSKLKPFRANQLFFLLIVIGLLGLQACAQQQEPSGEEITTLSPGVPGGDTGYPASGSSIEGEAEAYPAYPGPGASSSVDAEANEPLKPLPAPAAGMATVGGIIIDRATNQAPKEAGLYLGTIVIADTGLRVVRLNQEEDLVTVPTQNGQFIFEDVPPGEYGLILFHPDISFVVDNPEDGFSLIFNVEPDQVMNLGEIPVNIP